MNRYKSACEVVSLALLLGALAGPALAQIDKGPDFYAPGDAPSWTELKRSYAVDRSKPPVVTEEDRPGTAVITKHIVLTGPRGEQVPGAFMRPKAEGVYPVILLLHGLTSDKDVMMRTYGVPLVEHSFAVLALDAPFHGERKKKDITQTDTDVFGDTIHEGCREYELALDWLCARKDIDVKRIGLLGYNMGSIMGAILGGIDERIQALALCAGGDPIVSFAPNIPEGKRDAMYSISPSLFVGHISPRKIYMLNGRQDQVMLQTATERLYDAAQKPKTIQWYETGHMLPPDHIYKAVSWLRDQFHPIGQAKAPGD